MLHSMRAAAVAALLGIVVAHPATAGVIFNLNVNGIGSYSIDGGITFVDDPGVLEADPSSSIGVPVLTFAFPLGFGSFPGDVGVKDVTKDIRAKHGEWNPGLSIHEMGTARMGKDPKTSVLNGWNQAHDIPNLFVTDGASMASSASQNPSLTYMALTARAADYAVQQLKLGKI